MTVSSLISESNPENAERIRFIFCAGMRRGGSTLQTQLVSAICGGPRVHLVNPGTVRDFIQQHESDDRIVIVKCHEFLPEAAELSAAGKAKIVYVYRDIRDVVASIVRKYNVPAFSFIYGGLAALLLEARNWTELPDIHTARYETMTTDIAQEAREIARFLNIELTDEAAANLAKEFSVSNQQQKIRSAAKELEAGEGENRFDTTTLLHHNHIQTGGSGDYVNILPRNVIAALEWLAREWMTKQSYPPVTSRAEQLLALSGFRLKGLAHRLRVWLMSFRSGNPSV